VTTGHAAIRRARDLLEPSFIPAGLLLNGIGFTFDMVAPGGRIYWNGTPSEWFFAAWALVVACLIIGDLRQSR
jgi:hypothetical protein